MRRQVRQVVRKTSQHFSRADIISARYQLGGADVAEAPKHYETIAELNLRMRRPRLFPTNCSASLNTAHGAHVTVAAKPASGSDQHIASGQRGPAGGGWDEAAITPPG